MRKIYSVLLAIIGTSNTGYANCYEKIKELNFCNDGITAQTDYDICADLNELDRLTELYYKKTTGEIQKQELIALADIIAQRIKLFGCIGLLRANVICAICHDDPPGGGQAK